jgi:hypothetical protein
MSSLTVLAPLAVVGLAVVLAVTESLIGEEVKGWLPHLSRSIARSAARRLPLGQRGRYEEEWLAELTAYDDRRLTGLVVACGFWRAVVEMRCDLAPTRAMLVLLDRACGAVMTLVLAPLLVGIALAIWLDSRGPIFRRATRVDSDGRVQRVFRFRTSTPPPPAELYVVPPVVSERARSLGLELPAALHAPAPYAIQTETRVGRVLRRSSLEYLPFCVNVARGEYRVPWRWIVEDVRYLARIAIEQARAWRPF